jgi:HlyD family secretion protein
MRKLIIAISGAALIAAAWLAWRVVSRINGNVGTLVVSGNIEAHESLVSFKAVQSRIVDLPFDEGQWVEAGTLLARLDDSDYRKQVEVDAAALDGQRRELAAAEQRLAAARATVLADEADLAQRDIDYRRAAELYSKEVISTQSRDLSQTALKQSQAVLQRDRANVRVAERDVSVARANIESAAKTLDLARIVLGYTTLRAPFSGVILVRQAELGEVMQPGAPVVTLADLDHVWLRAYISETDLARIRWGQAATITTDSYPGRAFDGRISFIASNAEFTPKSVETHKERVTLVYRIKIDLANPEHLLKPGMPADALIELQGSPGPGPASPGAGQPQTLPAPDHG